ncbi:hypothetical protein GGTG_00083 [Gaeumannomyces tritici R3-111a-1]|uniref:Uncharacterized protein n=1 Tax=Gaeumannomyces tritici (strain R3-111a-1) TaxID=644352 RepID=J3NFN8_GAET3|nr:hypothetical protein GGTG_00083 [Gaeumannomyces tritici R3-111a-1]EJT80078.1 hypothetical protein GGTG_00083 [Gaeumannomyces tritici R3-111a-1]
MDIFRWCVYADKLQALRYRVSFARCPHQARPRSSATAYACLPSVGGYIHLLTHTQHMSKSRILGATRLPRVGAAGGGGEEFWIATGGGTMAQPTRPEGSGTIVLEYAGYSSSINHDMLHRQFTMVAEHTIQRTPLPTKNSRVCCPVTWHSFQVSAVSETPKSRALARPPGRDQGSERPAETATDRRRRTVGGRVNDEKDPAGPPVRRPGMEPPRLLGKPSLLSLSVYLLTYYLPD